MSYFKPKLSLAAGVVVRSIMAFVLMSGSGIMLLSTSPVSADNDGRTLYVGHSAIGTGKSCESPGYNSVQAAVDVANSGEAVYLCGAPFAEQVFVSKDLVLEGDSTSGLTAVGTTFASTASRFPSKFATDGLALPKALLVETGANTSLTVKGLSFDGPISGDSGCAVDEFGVLALGGSLSMRNSQVLNIADADTSLYGCQFGVAIQVGREYWPTASFDSDVQENFAATADLNSVTVSGYQKNGITVDGVGSKVTADGITVTGGGAGAPFGTIIAQNGIQISRGATGSVTHSSVNDNAYSAGGFAWATGVLVFGGCGDPVSTGVNISHDSFANNDVAIDFANYTANPNCVAPSSTATNDRATHDSVSSSAVTNTSGLCNGSVSCGGQVIGYQAGVQDVGNGDTISHITVSGAGYADQGMYNYSVNPPVFTKTGANNAFVRDVDAGASFPTLNAKVAHITG